MTEDNDRDFRLSRRKALAGLGTIGAATALGGIGTWAQFTDEESAEITFTAGGIDGHIEAHHRYNGEVQTSFDPQPVPGEGGGVEIELDDVKPGDYGSVCFEIWVESNPAWVASCIGIDVDSDHDTYEPEVAADSDVNAGDVGSQLGNSPDGELAENLYVIPFYRDSCPSAFWDPDGLDEDGNPQFGSATSVEYDALASQGAVGTMEDFWNSREGTNDFADLQPLTLREAAGNQSLDTQTWYDGTSSSLEAPEDTDLEDGCVFLNGQLADGGDTNSDDQEASALPPGSSMFFGYDWHVPFNTGNVAQGDRVVFNLGFNFAQIRHTEAPELQNIYAPGQNTPDGT